MDLQAEIAKAVKAALGAAQTAPVTTAPVTLGFTVAPKAVKAPKAAIPASTLPPVGATITIAVQVSAARNTSAGANITGTDAAGYVVNLYTMHPDSPQARRYRKG